MFWCITIFGQILQSIIAIIKTVFRANPGTLVRICTGQSFSTSLQNFLLILQLLLISADLCKFTIVCSNKKKIITNKPFSAKEHNTITTEFGKFRFQHHCCKIILEGISALDVKQYLFKAQKICLPLCGDRLSQTCIWLWVVKREMNSKSSLIYELKKSILL